MEPTTTTTVTATSAGTKALGLLKTLAIGTTWFGGGGLIACLLFCRGKGLFGALSKPIFDGADHAPSMSHAVLGKTVGLGFGLLEAAMDTAFMGAVFVAGGIGGLVTQQVYYACGYKHALAVTLATPIFVLGKKAWNVIRDRQGEHNE